MTLLCSETWPYHTRSRLTVDHWQAHFGPAWIRADDAETYWITARGERAGIVRISDLDDSGAPLLDVRISSRFRGRRVGTHVMPTIASIVFTPHPAVTRIEANTRIDNVAMRRLLERHNWVKESHWRKSWPDENGNHYDGIGYGLLREDWNSGRVTPLDWYS